MPAENRPLRIAIVGASSLRGKELKLVVEERDFPGADISLLDTSLPPGTLAEAAGEVTFVKPMEPDSFAGADIVFFAGTGEEARANWKLAHDSGASIIDLTGALESVAGAAAWIPEMETLLPPPEPKGGRPAPQKIYSSPPPAVLIACALAAALQDSKPSRLAIVFFPPVSERDQRGVDELEKQTADLLMLHPFSQSVFDTQIAFNLLAGYGEASRPSLVEMRSEIAKRIAAYLSGRALIPAVQLIQAPVFYGYAFSAYAEFAAPLDAAKIEKALVGVGIHLAAKNDPSPTNVSVAGEERIQLARVERDANVPAGIWLWGVADNLRLAVVNAVRIAEELLAPKI
ncbi:MAG TPA: Asd/ArgC dimerization domain-containing protein [Candidatus Acidoferrales bacterium]|nr:Asd/ArgC dimerization domain-containing protein [Candidatus Acidoferrales bacterium]